MLALTENRIRCLFPINLSRCVQELRMKGASFDLSRELAAQGGAKKRMKSFSVEVSWRPLRWCYQNLVTIGILCVTGVVVPASKFILCA